MTMVKSDRPMQMEKCVWKRLRIEEGDSDWVFQCLEEGEIVRLRSEPGTLEPK